MNEYIRPDLNSRINQVLQKKNDLDRRACKIGHEYTLQSSEMTLLQCLGSNPGKSVTALAGVLQITKGAVSQTLKRLDSKELLQRDEDPANASRALLSLSLRGRFVLQKYQDRQRVVESSFNRYLSRLSSRDARTINEFLQQYDSILDI
ncbi:MULTISPECIES: MarR family winged helix-turn-helix transcriptional regulator [unclassified Oceanispirochaeta]|uniref:MarR family winged helix-turn-helix transcriptional regulator n=1 Tax=unclassified Oceanispirochaeta TaxID=2635722 RepID=UPI000E095627|nr:MULTISPECIES: MarR family transcriptional regulator [unclassified Oceanispirochaeta]MBF9017527.1 MarR family transcriptional regulator [Oceanispirochaeta sp. M2]NPD74099.1 MarR family transcriptional regulator [Oceanispirochaeta sp. M1]RDG30139.1 MarR family transcriptional regulator [Oceanispirochaeta sp. M1]